MHQRSRSIYIAPRHGPSCYDFKVAR